MMSAAAGAQSSALAMKRKPAVVVGSVNSDLLVAVPRLPLPGETLVASGGGNQIPGDFVTPFNSSVQI